MRFELTCKRTAWPQLQFGGVAQHVEHQDVELTIDAANKVELIPRHPRAAPRRLRLELPEALRHT